MDADDRIGQDPPDLPPIPALLWDKGQQFLFSILGDPEVEVMSEAQYKVLNPAGGLLTTQAYGKKHRTFAFHGEYVPETTFPNPAFRCIRNRVWNQSSGL